MTLQDSILIQRNAISAADLTLLADYVRQATMTDSLVSNFEDDSEDRGVEWVVNRKVRDTQQIHLSSAVADTLHGIDDACIAAYIDPFYVVKVCGRESPQILHYGVGGQYIPHVDSETLYKDEIGLEMWEKTLDRDLSVVYFLNDDFEGGELVFPDLDLLIRPRSGTLVCFPSDHNFIHGVNPVTTGHRYTVVTWMRVRGTPTPDEINEMALEEYNRSWPKQVQQPSRISRRGSR